MGSRSQLHAGIIGSIVALVLLSALAGAQTAPSLQTDVPTLFMSDGALVEEEPAATGQCEPILFGPGDAASNTFTWSTLPANSSYHAFGDIVINLAYTSGAAGGAGQPATSGVAVTVTLRFGSVEIGSHTETIDASVPSGGTTHTITVPDPPPVAPAGSQVNVDVAFASTTPSTPQNIALECGADSNVQGFRVTAGAPGDGDLDGDGVPDAEDPDIDGDGIPNAQESGIACDVNDVSYEFHRDARLQPGENDADNDNHFDEAECAAGSDPLSQLSTPPEPAGFPWGLLILGIILLALIAAILFFFLTFGKAVQVEILSSPELIVPKGEEGKFQLQVTNLRKKGNPINYQLAVLGTPEGWDAKLDQDHVVLDAQGGAKSSETLWLTVESPEHDEGESAVVTVRAVALTAKGKKDTLKLPGKAKTITSINIPPDAKVPVKRGAPVKVKTEKEKTKKAGAGDVEKVIDVEGIGPEFAKKLEEAGVADTKQLLEADADKLAKKTGISQNLIVTWQQMADLIRIDGIAGQIAELLVRSGITSVEQLAGMEPKAVVDDCQAYLKTVERPPTKQNITEKITKKWIQGAQKLVGVPESAAAAEESKPAKGKKGKEEAAPAAAPAGEKPQLQVGNLQHSPPSFRKGQDVKSSVTVTNQGQSPHSLKLSLYVNDQLADAQTVNVKPGKTKDVKFKWTAQEQNRLNIRGEIVPS